jgi:hypothetical protein
VSSDNDLRMELIVFQSFLAEAVERGLPNAALLLTEQVATRKQALAKLDQSKVGKLV